MNTSSELEKSPSNRAPIREQRASILFMLFLLIVSGVTASVVGFRVKSADLDRKSQLMATYEKFGGSRIKAHELGATLAKETNTPEQNTFIAAYEVNSRARAYGLYRFLESTEAADMDRTVQSLFQIGATEAAHSTEDAWRAFQVPVKTGEAGGDMTGKNYNKNSMNPKAARFARQYDRYIARDTEVKLFAYLRDHRTAIGK